MPRAAESTSRPSEPLEEARSALATVPLGAALLAVCCWAAPPPAGAAPPVPAPAPKPSADSRPAAPKPDERGFVPLGSVLLNAKRGVVEAEGFFNLQQGLLEFLACGVGVKPHETLVALDVDPVHLNTALIAIGLRPGRRPEHDADLRAIPGDRMVIHLRWSEPGEDGKPVVRRFRAEDVILNYLADDTMQHVGFVYTGSTRIPKEPPRPGESAPPESELVYAPSLLGQFVSLVHRPYAIADNPLELPYPDPEYGAHPGVLPKVDRDRPVRVTLEFRRARPGEIDLSIRRMKIKLRRPPAGEEGGDGGGVSGEDGGGGSESEEGGKRATGSAGGARSG